MIHRIEIFYNSDLGFYEGQIFAKDGQVGGATGGSVFSVIDSMAKIAMTHEEYSERESNP